LDGVGGRADRLAVGGDVPPELPDWLETIGQENVRTLSVMLLIDLLSMERDAARADEIAHDMAALGEDLLMAGAYEDTRSVTRALASRAASAGIGAAACRDALDKLGSSNALRETAAVLGDIDEDMLAVVGDIITTIGPASIESLKAVLA